MIMEKIKEFGHETDLGQVAKVGGRYIAFPLDRRIEKEIFSSHKQAREWLIRTYTDSLARDQGR